MTHLEQADTKELGEAIDMIKDLEEAIYYKTITYMYRWNARIGLLLYPISNSNSIAINEHHILETDGCVVKVGFPIPEFNGTFFDFSEKYFFHINFIHKSFNKNSCCPIVFCHMIRISQT